MDKKRRLSAEKNLAELDNKRKSQMTGQVLRRGCSQSLVTLVLDMFVVQLIGFVRRKGSREGETQKGLQGEGEKEICNAQEEDFDTEDKGNEDHLEQGAKAGKNVHGEEKGDPSGEEEGFG